MELKVVDTRGDDDIGDLKNRNVVGLGNHLLDEIGTNAGTGDRGTEADFAVIHLSDGEESGLVGGNAGGLEEGGELSVLFLGELLEFGRVVVVEDDVNGENTLDDVYGTVGDGIEARVVDGENGDGLAAVDLIGEAGLSEEIIEGGEVRVVGEETGDVEGGGGGGGNGGEEKEEEGSVLGVHLVLVRTFL